jgi:hypothetical protein
VAGNKNGEPVILVVTDQNFPVVMYSADEGQCIGVVRLEDGSIKDIGFLVDCIKAKYYNAQKSVIFHLGPDSIAMHSLTTQWCFSQSSKMMMNALLVHHI